MQSLLLVLGAVIGLGWYWGNTHFLDAKGHIVIIEGVFEGLAPVTLYWLIQFPDWPGYAVAKFISCLYLWCAMVLLPFVSFAWRVHRVRRSSKEDVIS